ncbi:BMP family lipoprotein [Suipraeoptans intestinalis]|uniref:BMP family ABC transporter substrate-binding protein n=1 Tax=Suipraeoptans intestinalis TaxID=2606628 RepID=A0A6N7URH6_9FIRM|nr:BMP family ABC transporter substrate-binding protein [Suipraeoptans intestinalis]MDD7769963.1 BMP family ABC transporter substrate-binding protein [Suipraeoptans intestinalis]MDY3121724.1 BMP family ABC transporter substrate-binding protein [Suipraeoptans intestinalis]MSR93321.1 BMP family ABC transporter substrate-binding protein [Suipraeoptans intestinalis]
MKKRVVSLFLVAAMTVGLVAGCVSKKAASDDGDKKKGEGYELALITDVGTIDDKSFNQGSWEGLEKYAKENNISHKYYKPEEKSDEACLAAIDLAVKGGAKLVVTPGFLFEGPIHEAQSKYPDVSFILIDAEPKDADGKVDIADNTLAIYYAEEQAGYLAGYAAVKEGYKKLGFMGGIAVPAVIRYGYGYIQGADAAAKELGLNAGDVSIKYTYVGNFEASPENQTLAKSWYTEGVECIFACGGAVGNSVMAAAEGEGTTVIGVDVDQSGESDTVITSAMKGLGISVYDAIASFYDKKFEGGKTLTFTAAEDGVGLAMETNRFKNFTQKDYDEIFGKLKDGSITVQKDDVAEDASGIATEIVKVENIQ